MPAVFRAEPRRLLVILATCVFVALPVTYIVAQTIAASRNIVFWDEFDTALDFILRLDAGAGWPEIVHRIVAINNEHRTVMSKLLFAISYWLTGTVNFHVVGAIGNLFFFGTCAVLIAAVSGWERRVRLAVVLALLMFQLEHFESFIWSGASIDHFQVVMHAVIAIAALSRVVRATPASQAAAPEAGAAAPSRLSGWFWVAGFFAVLATFTLAQGNAVWVAGALLLAGARRWSEFGLWVALGVLAVGAFLHGFEVNPGHDIHEPSPRNLLHIGVYWLQLLGAPLTLGEAKFAPLPGVALLAALGFCAARDMPRRQPLAWFGALFAIGAIALIALGRAELAGTMVNSRYLVLGALAWSLVLFMLLELGAAAQPEHPFRQLVWLVPILAAFNVAADRKFAPMIDSFTEVRDRAATSFEQYAADGKGITRLHPRDRHADILMKMAEDRGVYRLPEFSRPVPLPEAKPNAQMIAYVDELVANNRAVTIGGWAMLPGKPSRRGSTYVVLRTARTQWVFSAVPLQRSDVATAYKEARWRDCGFRAVIRRERLPREDFDIGLIIVDGRTPDLKMTGDRLELSGAEPRVYRPAMP